MSTVQKVAKNTAVIMGGDLTFRLISFFVTIYLARYLGVEVWGKYSFAFAYLAFFGIITDLGLQDLLVREMSRNEVKISKLIGNAYVIRMILTVVGVLSALVVISVIGYPKDTTTFVYIAAFTLFFISFSDFYRTIFQANLKMEYNMIAKLTNRVISAVLVLYIIFVIEGTVNQILLVLVLSEGIKTLINYYFSRRFVRPDFEMDFGLWKYLLRECWPLALSEVIWIIYFRIDVVMLSAMVGDAPVGLYSAAYKLYEPLSLIPKALTMSLFPIMSASLKKSDGRLLTTYRLGFKYILIITLPLAIGITLLSDRLILLVYGSEFANSAIALQILIWAFIFTSLTSVLTKLLVSIGKQKLTMVATATTCVFNIVLNFILIPSMGFIGASIVTVTSSALFLVISYYFICKNLQGINVYKIVPKPAISGLIMGASIYYFINMSLFMLVPLAAIVYFVALLCLKTFSEEDWSILKRVLDSVR